MTVMEFFVFGVLAHCWMIGVCGPWRVRCALRLSLRHTSKR